MKVTRKKLVRCALGLVCGVAGVTSPGCGDDVTLNGVEHALIEANVQPESDCGFTEESRVVARGLYDVEGAASLSCSGHYSLNLRVSNRHATTVVFDSATVTLEDMEGKTLELERLESQSATKPPKKKTLPSSFETRTAAPVAGGALGIVPTIVIPRDYAEAIKWFDMILATIVLRGKAESGENVVSRPFTYPIELCYGCLRVCSSHVLGESLESVFGDSCDDNAGADGRVCVDQGC